MMVMNEVRETVMEDSRVAKVVEIMIINPNWIWQPFHHISKPIFKDSAKRWLKL